MHQITSLGFVFPIFLKKYSCFPFNCYSWEENPTVRERELAEKTKRLANITTALTGFECGRGEGGTRGQ